MKEGGGGGGAKRVTSRFHEPKTCVSHVTKQEFHASGNLSFKKSLKVSDARTFSMFTNRQSAWL